MKNSILILFAFIAILCSCRTNNLDGHVLVNKRVLYELNVLESALEIDVRPFEKAPTEDFVVKEEFAKAMARVKRLQPKIETKIVERLKESADSYEIGNELMKGLKLNLESNLEFGEVNKEEEHDYKFQITIEFIELVRKADDWYINLRAKSHLIYKTEDEIIWENREYRFIPFCKHNYDLSTNIGAKINADLISVNVMELNEEKLKNLLKNASFQAGLEIGEIFMSDYKKVNR